MVRSRKQSKRMPARKRYKIERKVREHKRKMKKEAKSQEKTKKLKKDPGIPNLFPFKEQLLKQMEDRKLRSEEERVRQKLQRQKEHAKRRSLQGLQNDAQKRTKEFEKKQELQTEVDASTGPYKSLRAYYKEFRKVVEASDVVLEVLDARDPLGCRCFQVEQAVLASGANKKLILVMNKIDLVPKEIVEAWLKHLRNEFPTVAFKASTQTQKHNLSQKKFSLGTGSASLMNTSACLGAEVLLKLLGNYCRNVDIKTSITVGVVGLPNVGKSSIINSLKRSKACGVGDTPGVTKTLQEVQLDKHVKLLDSPGVVMATSAGDTATMILRNCVKVESLSDPITPVEAILRRCNRYQVMEHYCIPEYDDVQEFLSHLAKRIGKLKKGGIPDIEAAARSILRDWNTGQIKFYTHPPDQQSLPSHVSADVVKQWSAAFDIKSLVEEEREELKGLQRQGSSMMEVQPSEPLLVAFGVEEEKDDDEESALEEEMDSELSDEEVSEKEMENYRDSSDRQDGGMTVVLPKKTSKTNFKLADSSGTGKTKMQMKKNPKRRQQLRKIIDHHSDGDHSHADSDVKMADSDSYNFDDYF